MFVRKSKYNALKIDNDFLVDEIKDLKKINLSKDAMIEGLLFDISNLEKENKKLIERLEKRDLVHQGIANILNYDGNPQVRS